MSGGRRLCRGDLAGRPNSVIHPFLVMSHSEGWFSFEVWGRFSPLNLLTAMLSLTHRYRHLQRARKTEKTPGKIVKECAHFITPPPVVPLCQAGGTLAAAHLAVSPCSWLLLFMPQFPCGPHQRGCFCSPASRAPRLTLRLSVLPSISPLVLPG